MGRKHYVLVLALAVVAGLVGGRLSSVILAGALVFPASEQKIVEAQEFRLVGEEGKVCAKLFSEGVSPGLALYDQDGKKVAALRVTEDGSPNLVLFGQGGKPRAVFGMVGNGSPGLDFFDQSGNPIWSAP